MRFVFALLCWAGMYALTVYIAGSFLGTLMTIGVWVLEVGFTTRAFMVSVPEACALVTTDLLKSLVRGMIPLWNHPFYNLQTYDTGLHFRFPWEQVKEGNYINLRVVTFPFRGETYPSKNGPMMKADWSIQFHPRLEMLPRYIYVGISTIMEGLHEVGSSFLSSEIKKMDPEQVRLGQKDLENRLREHFNLATHRVDDAGLQTGLSTLTGKSPSPNVSLEDFYGIELAKTSIADVDYSAEYQKVLESQAVAERLGEISDQLTKGDINRKQAMEAAMVINKNVTKEIRENVQEIRGEGANAIASFLMALANAAGKGGE